MQRSVGEGLPMPFAIDRYIVRRKVFVEKSFQYWLQRWITPRNSPFIFVLAIATGRSSSRRLRDTEGDHLGHGVVSRFYNVFFFFYNKTAMNKEVQSWFICDIVGVKNVAIKTMTVEYIFFSTVSQCTRRRSADSYRRWLSSIGGWRGTLCETACRRTCLPSRAKYRSFGHQGKTNSSNFSF